MANIVLISCGKAKLKTDARAEKLYIGTPFKMQLAYAKLLEPDEIFILSAKHHLLPLDQVISPYDVTLSRMKSVESKEWGKKTVVKLEEHCDLDEDEFTVLAPEAYVAPLRGHLRLIDTPLQGKKQGQRLSFLKSKIQELS